MSKELQEEKVSEKKRFKPVRQNKQGRYWSDFETCLNPVPLAKRRAYFEELFEYCELRDDEPVKLKRYSIERWAIKKRIRAGRLEDWSKEDEYCMHLYKLAKASLGCRIEDGIIDKEKNDKILFQLYNYLDRYERHDKREDERKVKLASQGVTTGETKIIVVNENVKTEGEE